MKNTETPDLFKGKIRESYSHKKADARKARRRDEADDRQGKYNAMTVAERFAMVVKRGGSKRELARLTKLMHPEKHTTKTNAPLANPVVVSQVEEKPKNKYRKGKKAKA